MSGSIVAIGMQPSPAAQASTSGLSPGGIIGVAVGAALAGLALIALLVALVLRKRKTGTRAPRTSEGADGRVGGNASTADDVA